VSVVVVTRPCRGQASRAMAERLAGRGRRVAVAVPVCGSSAEIDSAAEMSALVAPSPGDVPSHVNRA
jgi:hypothetical protein